MTVGTVTISTVITDTVRPPLYPFAALVGQDSLRLALLLCATDPALGVLLRGDKGAAKSTAARALAELLPGGAPFVNLPVGASEDRLMGGLDLEKALQGESALKPGLLAQAHGGVLYTDEVNLLPGHLIDALLDVAASGVNVLERDGFSQVHPARFVLLGSMNPEEGALRPQLLDRFALVAEVHAPLRLEERREILARRLAFDADPEGFRAGWITEQEALKSRLEQARAALNEIHLPPELLSEVAEVVCRHGVTSLRADLALVRAARAHAALEGRAEVTLYDIEMTLPLVLAHRMPPGMSPPQAPQSQPPEPQPPELQNPGAQAPQQEKQPPPPPPEAQDDHPADSQSSESSPPTETPDSVQERVFAALPAQTPRLMVAAGGQAGRQTSPAGEARGRVIRSLPGPQPRELDLRASLTSALGRSGTGTLTRDDLHGRVREAVGGKLLTLVIDASGSHAQGGRMGAVKGAALALLGTLGSADQAAVIAFRGAQAELLCPPSQGAAARQALEYLPTGGRTPLAHALELATELLAGADFTGGTLALFTDGRANVPTRTGDPWQDTLSAAQTLRATLPTLDIQLIDTESGPRTLGRSRLLAEALGAAYSVLLPADGPR
ncbi:VWA domain-containing protein [Deinococcus altitudinis]|uniref:VWA domain-containing protein n=1 Tax=Deinococcus altitudinis TaxID=468914 RepID=UPI003892C50B